PAQGDRLRGMGREHVERRQRKRGALKLRNRRRKLAEKILEKLFLPRQCALLRRKRLVLECLELGSDIALCVLERLSAAEIGRNSLDVSMTHFDIKAVHAVVFHLEGGDASPFTLARFELDQECAAVALDRTQLVELRVVTGSDD